MSPSARLDTESPAPASVTSETGEDLPRVLVVTSIKLLSLLAICRQGSVDGTFASMSKLWKQLFMFLGNLDNSHIPICWGYLPDKSFRSYYVFLYMVLFAFRGRREEIIKITSLVNIKMKLHSTTLSEVSVDWFLFLPSCMKMP